MKKLILLALLLNLQLFAQTSDFEHINFEKADGVAKRLKGASLQNMPILVHQLTSGLDTDVEKFRAIYYWVCLNIKNDYRSHVQNLSKRKKFQNDSLALYNWNNEFQKRALKKLKKHKKTICTGYAYLLQELALFAGLDCIMVHGYGRTVGTNIDKLSIPNHSWNVVELNGKWYLCDPTWSSGFFHFDEGRFVAQFNDGYFLANPKLFVKSHYPLETKWLLTRNSFTIKDFLTGPLVYGNTFKYRVTPISPLKMKVDIPQNEKLIFKFEISDDLNIKDISLMIGSSSSKNNIKTARLKNGQRILEIESVFKRRGLYDVHLKVKDDVLATYTVKVVKNKS